MPPWVHPNLDWKTSTHLMLVLEPWRITFDACRDALVCFKGRFNFYAFGLNICFLISRNCSQFSGCQLTALCTSLSPACCALTSLSPVIILAGRDKEGGRKRDLHKLKIAHGETLGNGDRRTLKQDPENTYGNIWRWERIVIHYELIPQWSAQISKQSGPWAVSKEASIQNKGGECAALLSKQQISLQGMGSETRLSD